MKKWFLISGIALVIGVFSYLLWGAYIDSVKSDISKSQDTSMEAFRGAKSLGSFYPKYLSISSDDSYKELKKSMKDRMSDSLYEELFYFDEYPIVNKDVLITVNSVRGHKFGKKEFEFKLDVDYASSGNLYNFQYQIGVDNGVITYIKRIK